MNQPGGVVMNIDRVGWGLIALCLVMTGAAWGQQEPYSPAVRNSFPDNVYWGDTHVHTNLSYDAVFRLTAEEAYRFAKGEVVTSSTRQPARIRRPLDFLVVADHGENMGAEITRDQVDADPELGKTGAGKEWLEARDELLATEDVDRKTVLEGSFWPRNTNVAIRHAGFRRVIWERVTAAAERHNEPGRFTAFIGYEWTSTHNAIHRVVVFKDGAERANKVVPFSTLDSPYPEELWDYLGRYRETTGGDALAIPHNSNLTFGTMFALIDSDGNELSKEYAERRSEWEPIVEVTQIKGDSETHPVISPTDEFADFERWAGWAGRTNGGVMWTGNNVPLRDDSLIPFEYVRSALKNGLDQLVKTGANPFKFGLIGSTDSHTALTAVEEDNFWGKSLFAEPSPWRINGQYAVLNWEMSASGYAGVWAHENTRESIFAALRRKEVYATTGPRMTVRFFGGWDFSKDDADAPNLTEIGYARGVPMGGDLIGGEDSAPTFLISVLKDPDGANLDRAQVVKGWRDGDGELHEKIYDVAWSGDRKIGPDGKLVAIRSTVDVARATYTNAVGSAELRTVWRDPDFDPGQPAFYYVRVLQIPTPRWTAYDAAFYKLENLPEKIPMVIQERAYTSPIWYTTTES
jgi:hypothetical protein